MPDQVLVEKRFIQNEGCQFRSSTNEDGEEQKYVTGIGVVYNKDTEIWPGFIERIAPGAFKNSLKSGGVVKSFINHRASNILSTTKSTPALELKDSKEGLQFTSPIPPTTYGNDLVVNLERENIKGASFSFTINEGGEKYKVDKDGTMYRTITDAVLYEIGPVTNPAYEQTEVSLRSKEHVLEKVKELTNENQQVVNRSNDELDIINAFLLKRKGV